MAGYDGSIRINTEITVKGSEKELKHLEGSMTKTADKITSLRSKMDALKDVKIPTDEYKEIQNQIEATEKKINDLQARQEKFVSTGGKESSSTYQRMQYDIEELKASLPYLKSELQDLEETGKAFTLGHDTEKYAQMSAQMQQLNQKMESDTQRQSELQSRLAAEEQRLADIKANATVSDQRIIDALERRRQLLAEIKNMEAAGVGLGTEQYDSAVSELQQVESEIKRYKSSLSEVPEKFSRMREAAQKAFNSIRSGLSKVGSFGKKAFSALASVAGKAFGTINNSSKKSGGILSTFASRLKGLALSLLIFNWISKGFNAMISGMKTGFSNFAGYSASFANSVQSMKNAMSTLGNQAAAAFAPLVQAVIPWLVSLINMLTRATAAIAQFIAALTGKSTFVKAKKNQDAYNKSLGGTASAAKKAGKALGALAEFDDLDVLDKKEGAGGGGGGGGGAGGMDFGDMFEEQDVSAEVQAFVDKLREAWENADFTEIGGIIGGKIRDALNAIPWDSVQETVNKVAKSLATLLNGIVETDGLADAIGKTIAEAINTGIGAVATFAENLHWDSIGKFISDGINGALTRIDWKTALTAASTLGTGIATALNNALTEDVFQNIGTTIGNGINTALTFAISFMNEFDFVQFGSSIGTGIKNAIATIDWSLLGETVGTAVQSIFDLFIGFVESSPLEGVGEKIGTGINNAIAAIDLESFASALSTFVIGLLNELSIAIETTDWSQVARDIVSALMAIDWMGIASGLFDVGLQLIGGLLEAFGELPAPVQIAAAAIGGFIAAFAGASIINSVTSLISALVVKIGMVVSVLGGPLTIAIAAVIAIGALLIANWDSIKDAAGKLASWLGKKWEEIKTAVSTTWESVKQIISETWDSIKETVRSSVEKLKSTISGAWEKIKTNVTETWDSIKEKVSNTWKDIKTTVSNTIEGVKTTISDAWKLVSSNFTETWDGVKKTVTDTWDAMKSYASTKVGEIKKDVSDTFSSLKKKVIEIWNGIKNGIKSPINDIIGFINKMISGVVSGINALIGALNKISFDIPDWVPEIGGKSFGIDLKKATAPQIPYLASGAVIRGGNPFVAILGDQPAGQVNVEAPLDTIEQAVEDVMNRRGYNNMPAGGFNPTITLNLDGQEFARLTLGDILQEASRQGYDVSVLGVT